MRLVRLNESVEDKYGRYLSMEKDKSFVDDFKKMIGYYSKKSNPKQLVNAVKKNPIKFWNRYAISCIMADTSKEAGDIYVAFRQEALDKDFDLADELGLSYNDANDLINKIDQKYQGNLSLVPARFKDQVDEVIDKSKRLDSSGSGISWWPTNLWKRYLNQLDDRYSGIKMRNKEIRVPLSYLEWDGRNGSVCTLGNCLTFTYKGKSVDINVYTHTSEGMDGCYGYSIERSWVYEEPSFKKFLDGLDEKIVYAFGERE